MSSVSSGVDFTIEWNKLLNQIFFMETKMKKLEIAAAKVKNEIHESSTKLGKLEFLLIAELVNIELHKHFPGESKGIDLVHPYVLQCDWGRINSIKSKLSEKKKELKCLCEEQKALHVTLHELESKKAAMSAQRCV